MIWLRRDREVSVNTVAISIVVSTRRLGTDAASAGVRVGLGTAGVRRGSWNRVLRPNRLAID